MTDTYESGEDVVLYGKSGQTYHGKIYSDRNGTSSITTKAIVCLSNHSSRVDDQWQHSIRDIYDTDNIPQALAHFRDRDDISHLILIPREPNEPGNFDKIDDLRRNYIHG